MKSAIVAIVAASPSINKQDIAEALRKQGVARNSTYVAIRSLITDGVLSDTMHHINMVEQ